MLPLLEGHGSLLDICRGASVDGIIGVLAAGRGLDVTIVSPSRNHANSLKRFASELGVEAESINFVLGSLDKLTQLNLGKFDCVTALHVLEHADSPRVALESLRERTISQCIVAVPTCLNPTAWVRLGGSDPYTYGAGSWKALFRGFLKVLRAGLSGRISVVELVSEFGTETVHPWYLPKRLIHELEWSGFHIEEVRPDTLLLPWSQRLLPLARKLQGLRTLGPVATWGFGTHFVLRPLWRDESVLVQRRASE
ncbi:class I SAM-dependent methyltransferase [Paenarthrobacter nicotinovorans]|uniref:class I SAM-dependent methyltransferase n=1 Tax=Paenarthrobacter nicotinovorans TaxID=29320 RepID=UPI003D67417D